MAGLLVASWHDGGTKYRLVAVGDAFQIELQSVDSMGDPRWDRAQHVTRTDTTSHMLARVVALMVLAVDEAAASAYKVGGWDAVSDVLRSRKEEAPAWLPEPILPSTVGRK